MLNLLVYVPLSAKFAFIVIFLKFNTKLKRNGRLKYFSISKLKLQIEWRYLPITMFNVTQKFSVKASTEEN